MRWRPANWSEGGAAVRGLKVTVLCLALAMMLGWTMAGWNCYRIWRLEERMQRLEKEVPKVKVVRPGNSVEHIAAKPDMKSRKQLCSRCGEVLIESISFPPFEAIWPPEKPVYVWAHGSAVRCETETYEACVRSHDE